MLIYNYRKGKQEREVNTMMTLVAIKGNERIEKDFSQYFQALTIAINLQNKGYTVEIKRN